MLILFCCFRNLNLDLLAYTASANGNCLFNSIFLAMYGDEMDAVELRVRCSVAMYLSAGDLFTPTALSKIFGREITMEDINFIIISSEEGECLRDSVEERAKETCSLNG